MEVIFSVIDRLPERLGLALLLIIVTPLVVAMIVASEASRALDALARVTRSLAARMLGVIDEE